MPDFGHLFCLAKIVTFWNSSKASYDKKQIIFKKYAKIVAWI